MNLNKLQVTDDLQEQIAYGRELMDTYDSDMLKFINNIYDSYVSGGGELPLSQQDMLCKATYDYWMYGFTPEQQIYFQLFNKTHEEKKLYMSFRSEYLYYARLNAKADMNYLEDKYEAYKLLKPYFKREVIKISSEEDYPQFLDFIGRHPQFVLKPLGLSNTKGVKFIDSTKYEDKKALYVTMLNAGESFTGDYTVKWCKHDSAVLEELIDMDPEFGAHSPKSLNIIRIPTVRVNGKVYVYGAYTKIGGSDELIVGESRNAYMCGVDCETGELVTNGFTEDGKELECHPVSGLKFKGFKFPKWDELIKMLHEMAIQLKPTINYVGWDVVLTPKGWVIVEGNYYGQTLWQVVYKRGMAKEFGDLIGWHMEEGKPWWKYKINQIEKSAGLHDFD